MNNEIDHARCPFFRQRVDYHGKTMVVCTMAKRKFESKADRDAYYKRYCVSNHRECPIFKVCKEDTDGK